MITKINISNIPIELPGYHNVCAGNGDNIHAIGVEPASCLEILAQEVIDYIPAKVAYNVLKDWTSKLRHKGKIVITGTDYVEIARKINLGQINTLELNQTLYGEQNDTWQFKVGCYTLPDVVDSLKAMGLKIIKQRLKDVTFEIEAMRP